jgi:hypothetical protein
MEDGALRVGLVKAQSVMVCSEWQIELQKLIELAGIAQLV